MLLLFADTAAAAVIERLCSDVVDHQLLVLLVKLSPGPLMHSTLAALAYRYLPMNAITPAPKYMPHQSAICFL